MASIQKRPSGVYRARYYDDTGTERARHFARRVDAQRFINEMTANLLTGQYVNPDAGRITLIEYYRDYAERQVWQETTERAMTLAVHSAPFAGMALMKVRRADLELWVKSMAVGGLKPSTIDTRLSNVRSVFRSAVRDRLIPLDPSEGVRPPRTPKRQVELRLPTPEDVRQLLEAAERPFRAFVGLAAFAGLRLGEIAGLQIADIDFMRRAVSVRRQVQRGSARGGQAGASVIIRDPKYGSSRIVPVPDGLLELIAEHIRCQRSGQPRDAWLFVSTQDQPPHQNTVGHWWRKTKKKAGIDRYSLHDLRHFYASGLIAAGCDVVTVQRALGHAKASTTLNTYSHLWPSGEDRTRTAAAGLMTTVGMPSAQLLTGTERD